MTYRTETALLLAFVGVVFVALGIAPRTDRMTWAMEVAPAVLGVGALVAAHARFKMTRVAHRLVAVHACILIVGGYYSYAEMPLGFWAKDAFGLARNHYDRVGHLAQGFIPAIVVRELLLRLSPLRRGAWLFFLVTCVCLAVSAFYELIEWWSAVAFGQSAEAFLGTQGDVWDAQWDMFLALCGAVTSQLALGWWHDRSFAELPALGQRVSSESA